MSDDKAKDRPGDQPMPVPNDGPSMHDLVCAQLEQLNPEVYPQASQVIADLQARKQLGFERYGSLLQAHNGRDALLDLYEELQDAVVYARQVQAEGTVGHAASSLASSLLSSLLAVRRLLNARD